MRRTGRADGCNSCSLPFEGFSALINADYAESNERSNTKPVIEVLTNYDNAAHTPRVTVVGGTGVPANAAQVTQQNTSTNTYTSLFQRSYFGGYQPIVGSWTRKISTTISRC